MTENEFIKELSNIGITINDEQLDLFRRYIDFLMEYNSHTNVTAIRSIEDTYLKHFYDSLLLLKYFDIKDKKILDIGSGAGFPGVPLKIIDSSIELVVLDSNGKKTKFLEELKGKLNLDYTVINDRAEKYVLNKREYFDIVVSRAVTAMPILAELTIPFVKVDGTMIAYKGILDDTIENGKYAIEVLGGVVDKVETIDLPKQAGVRTFVFVKKKCKTESTYPRIFDKITKKPLQKK